jgi:hypothetical protein
MDKEPVGHDPEETEADAELSEDLEVNEQEVDAIKGGEEV